ncbi:ABC transporter ATP-binding protein [Haloarcula onubensis]|uniref:ABC transporter ATP-binding protein/permease n=1 Tax=Haloarcula onubensis TaxID=2950539 RepID=A0ABU2FNE3_9EURY|nr:ABC transporter ATP-binding protein [Halomicroarcula sp. S3CR25-11]MDS0282280.1 ABC transporter ATP-binding protein/permease [Halomicroarcula sp. S3CR25-11]
MAARKRRTVENSESAVDNSRRQFRSLIQVARYRPVLTVAIVGVGVCAAGLEAVGLSFILPIVELVQQSGDPAAEASGVLLAFVTLYRTLGVPFTLGTVVAGVSAILTIRWTATFVVRWLRGALVFDYTRELQVRAFENALDARIDYFDNQGSDGILNAIVTQSEYAGDVIQIVINFLEQLFLSLVYLAIAFVLAPYLTVFSIVFLGAFSVFFQYLLESGYDIGSRVADANERVQQTAQAGTQGIRDTKLFNLKAELFEDFITSVDQFAESGVKKTRNEEIIQSFYNLLTAVSVFLLIYLAITFADMSLGSLGIFLFAMFRLGPKASNLNSLFYKIENKLPHLVRTQEFIRELEANREPTEATEDVPETIEHVELDEVCFSYDDDQEEVLSNVSLEFERGEFIAFVGESGAGKSTIVSLLTRLYEPDTGEIRANGVPVQEMDINEWRERIAVVRQDPFIFNETLRYNLTIGNRNVSQDELEEVARIASVDTFLPELPNGYDSQLGDDGVRLSGGQKQRVAIARALLKDAEILVLDEATSNLDSNLEKQVQEAIESMDRDYAIVGIAHRLSTVKRADRIYTVDSGEIIESGRHEQLLEKSGQYAELYSIQSRTE